MLATVFIILMTGNLAAGVLIGVLLSALLFTWKVRRALTVESSLDAGKDVRQYFVRGQVFFASSPGLVSRFDFNEPLRAVCLDLSHAHFWDITAIDALDQIVHKFQLRDIEVRVTGLDASSIALAGKYAKYARSASPTLECNGLHL